MAYRIEDLIMQNNSYKKDGFQNRLITSLISNKPFLKHFFNQYLDSLDEIEYQEFFRQFINSYDGSLTYNKDFYNTKSKVK
tara:strand:- start:756 stop:998 length:243 start_codon:yes stop_codon:yes gene_type:complete